LSYTTFQYGKLLSDKKEFRENETITFSIKVKNTGKKDGSEIVQLYIHDIKSSLPRPVKELKGFEKVALKAGEEKTVIFSVNKDDLRFFDDKKHEWIAEKGDFEAIIGASSVDIKDKYTFILK